MDVLDPKYGEKLRFFNGQITGPTSWTARYNVQDNVWKYCQWLGRESFTVWVGYYNPGDYKRLPRRFGLCWGQLKNGGLCWKKMKDKRRCGHCIYYKNKAAEKRPEATDGIPEERRICDESDDTTESEEEETTLQCNEEMGPDEKEVVQVIEEEANKLRDLATKEKKQVQWADLQPPAPKYDADDDQPLPPKKRKRPPKKKQELELPDAKKARIKLWGEALMPCRPKMVAVFFF